MAVTVYIPTPFRRATQNLDRVVTEAHDVGELLDRLEASVRRTPRAGARCARAASTTTSTST